MREHERERERERERGERRRREGVHICEYWINERERISMEKAHDRHICTNDRNHQFITHS